MEQLRRSGELDKTLIVFTADNGFFHGEHRVRGGKVLPYEPSIRVPLILRGPGVPRGAVRRQLVTNVDLAPTILDAADAPAGVGCWTAAPCSGCCATAAGNGAATC